MIGIRSFGRHRLLALLIGFAWCASPACGQVPPQKYALLIGLNSQRYEGVQVQGLKFATADVEALKDILVKPAFGFKVTALRDREAKREDIVAELRRFSRLVKSQDDFLLYFAGHGVRDATNGQTYWLTYDANLAELDVHGIRLLHLLEFVREIPAQRKLIILDHCYSGEIIDTLEGDPGRGVSSRARDAGIPVSAERSLVPRDLTADVNDILRTRSAGLTVLAASRGAAYELDPPVGHGLFTYVLVKALTTRSADTFHEGEAQGDRKLSVRELAGYVAEQIRSESKSRNVPQTALESLQGQELDSWFLGDLPAETDRQLDKITLYGSTLSSWRARNWISEKTFLHCSTMLSKWGDALQAGTTIGPEIERALAALGDAMNTGSPERARAENLETTVKALLQGENP